MNRWNRIIPAAFMMYTIAYIDRTNFSLAIPALQREFGLAAGGAGVAAGVFFLLAEVLPLGDELNTTTLRNNLHRVAERMEKELGEERKSFLPEAAPTPEGKQPIPPGKPAFTLGLDGAYVHAGGRAGWFEVIVGRSVPAAGASKYFGFVHNIEDKPKRRIYEVLRSQGLEADQPVQFLSDGAETVRNLQMYISPQSEHWLDWFHITMRLTVMGQMRKGMNGVEASALVEQAEQDLESLKWHVWNGNSNRR